MHDFRTQVCVLVQKIPVGSVMTYGQLAALAGHPRAARIVGGIAHYGDPKLPWHRVVNKRGGLASGYPGGRGAHAEHLRSEAIIVSAKYTINIEKYIYYPKNIHDALMKTTKV
ncbi:MAG: MGMT family protein [Candidatus Saccharimonadales bacterium]